MLLFFFVKRRKEFHILCRYHTTNGNNNGNNESTRQHFAQHQHVLHKDTLGSCSCCTLWKRHHVLQQQARVLIDFHSNLDAVTDPNSNKVPFRLHTLFAPPAGAQLSTSCRQNGTGCVWRKCANMKCRSLLLLLFLWKSLCVCAFLVLSRFACVCVCACVCACSR